MAIFPTKPTTRAERRAYLAGRGVALPPRSDVEFRNTMRKYEKTRPTKVRDLERLDDDEIRECALHLLDDKDVVRSLPSTAAGDAFERAIRFDPDLARRAIATERPAYRRAFAKVLLGAQSYTFSEEERDALIFAEEYKRLSQRAQGEATNAIGGYAVMPSIDPSVWFTDGPQPNDFMRLCSIETIVGKEWRGVVSPTNAWGFTAEAAQPGDQSLTSLTQPAIPTYTAEGFVKYSVEIGEDWPNFSAQMTKALAVGYDNLLVDKFTNGSGVGEPTGILTALAAASPTVIVTSSTDGAFSDTDIKNTWGALPGVFRRRAAWMCDVTVANQVRGSNLHSYQANLPDGASEYLIGRPLYENDAMPDWNATTGAANRLIVGDWQQMVIVQRAGMYVEPVQLMINTANNLPDGSRGLLARARIGADVPVTNAFRVQANT